MPTPSYAAPQTARPGTSASARRTAATRATWPTAYCGRPPPHRCTCESTGRTLSPTASAQVAQREVDQLVVGHLEHVLLAVPSDRAPEQERVAAGRARTHGHFAKE